MINVVLFEPEIPGNTGNIMRTCAATGTHLHLIKPLGFSLDESYIKRSGANYIKDCDYKVYENWDDFKSKNNGTYYYLTRYGKKPHTSFDYSNKDENIYLVFGKESSGIPLNIFNAGGSEYYFRFVVKSDCDSITSYDNLFIIDLRGT